MDVYSTSITRALLRFSLHGNIFRVCFSQHVHRCSSRQTHSLGQGGRNLKPTGNSFLHHVSLGWVGGGGYVSKKPSQCQPRHTAVTKKGCQVVRVSVRGVCMSKTCGRERPTERERVPWGLE